MINSLSKLTFPTVNSESELVNITIAINVKDRAIPVNITIAIVSRIA